MNIDLQAIVAANAGILDTASMYGPQNPDVSVPAEPNLKIVDVVLKGTIYTAFLALHYFRQNQVPGGKMTLTASSAALYPVWEAPLYTACKHAVSPFSGPNLFIKIRLTTFMVRRYLA